MGGHLIRPLGGGLLMAMLALPAMPGGIAIAAPAVTVSVVADGSGQQTDPHVSGDWVSYTDNSSHGIRFQNLALGSSSDRLIPTPDGFSDSLSDMSGNTIVFMRAGGGVQAIYEVQVDSAGNAGAATEVAPTPDLLRRRTAIGGDTIAWEDGGYDTSSSPRTEIALGSVSDPASPAYRLTSDDLMDEWPAVSPDGNAVVWLKCPTSSDCEVWRAERTEGVWGAPEQVTGAADNGSRVDTSGPVTVYAVSGGDDEDIRWSVKGPDGYVESVLDLPGDQRAPTISGHVIAFEGNAVPGEQFDIWLYDLETGGLYEVTDTTASETLTDIAVGGNGLIRVAWALPKQVSPYDLDVYAAAIPEWTPPTISAAISGGTMGSNGWYTSPVTVHFSCADDESGIPEGACPADEVLEADGASVSSTARTVTDAAGNVSEPSNVVTVKLDRTAPSGSVTIDEGAATTDSPDVTLGFTATDATSGVAQMRFADTSAGLASAAWQPFAAATKPYTLPEGPGTKTVFVEFRDAAGNVSEPVSDTIVLEAAAPAATVMIVDPAADVTIQDRYTFRASTTAIETLSFSIRADDGSPSGRPIRLERLAATASGDGTFTLAFQTWRLLDGRYLLLAEGTDAADTAIAAAPLHVRIANVALDRLTSATASESHAGELVPVTFSLTQGCKRTFVANESLTIVIRAKGSHQVLQRSTFGPDPTDYRIDAAAGRYSTSFQTRTAPATYIVEVWRQTPVLSVPVGTFEFRTVN